MTRHLLEIHVSPRGAESHSRQAAAGFVEALHAAGPAWQRTVRDLAAQPVPQLSADMVTAIRSHGPVDAALQPAIALSDTLIAELKAADAVLISTPMYNWGEPAALKAWLDQVMRVGHTFGYGANGVVGLLGDKPCLVIVASGGTYDNPERAAVDFLQPHLDRILRVIGLLPLFVRVDGTLMEDAADRAAAARQRLNALAAQWQAPQP